MQIVVLQAYNRLQIIQTDFTDFYTFLIPYKKRIYVAAIRFVKNMKTYKPDSMIIKHILLTIVALSFLSCKKEYSCEGCIPVSFPEVNTIAITDINHGSAKFHGALLKIGDTAVSDFGFCWATAPNPTINNNKVGNGSTSNTQGFNNIVTGLLENQVYYVRAYATNTKGTIYGQELSFTTLSNPLVNCLVAYYPFNGNTNDESGNNNNGVATGGSFATDKNGNVNKAYYFNGSDFIRVPNSSSLSGVGDNFSIAAWVYTENQFVTVVCKAGNGSSAMQFRLYSDAGGIHFANYGKAVDFTNTLTPINAWKHIVITSDGTTAKCYLNGSLVSSLPLHNDNSANDNTTDLYVGADTHNVTEFHKGKLDEIRIYCRVLSAEEVLQIYYY